MRAIFFTKYGESAAAYRARLALYLPYLRSQGVRCVVSNLEDGSFERLRLLKRLNEFDVAVVYHELFPHVPAALEERFLTIPYVFDFDDAIQTRETPFTRDKTSRLISGAKVAIAGSGELEAYARCFQKDVRLIPTIVDLERYERAERRPRPKDTPFTIGWIGTPQTTVYIPRVAEPLRKLSATRGARFVTVGAGPIELPGVRHEKRAWSEKTELADLTSFDVGIMPLSNDEWARGKCGFKLVQYHAIGIPSVASPIGANRAVIENGVTGLLAGTVEQWAASLTRLADDPELRAQMGRLALERARDRFCLAKTAPLFHQALIDAAGHKQVMRRNAFNKS